MNYFNPTTGELIVTDNPAEWMGSTDKAPPKFDGKTEGVFFIENAWSIVKAEQNQLDPKFVGVEIDGVMCSATGTDQNGLMAVFMAYQLQGASYPGTVFSFDNGNTLHIDQDNIQEFIAKWVPFRQSFFKPE